MKAAPAFQLTCFQNRRLSGPAFPESQDGLTQPSQYCRKGDTWRLGRPSGRILRIA